MAIKAATKNTMKLLEEESLGMEEILSDDFFKKYTSLGSLEEFEEKFNVKPEKGITKEKFINFIVSKYSEFKNIEELKMKAIEFYTYK